MKIRHIFALLALTGAACSLRAAPIPTVYWDGDFDTTQKTGSDGLVYTFNRNGNTVSGGKMTVGSAAGLISWPKSAGTQLTVLVKYSSLAAPTAPCSLLTFKTSADDDIGVRAQAAGSLNLVGYRTGATTAYGSKAVPSPAGYVYLSHSSSAGTMYATATEVSKLSRSDNASLKSAGTMSGVALGGPHAAAAYPAWGGVVIEAVAIFRDIHANTTTFISGYRFPSENVSYAATVSGDVANLQTSPNIAWSGAVLPAGGVADANVTFQMAAASTMKLPAATKFYTLALTGAGNAVFDDTGKMFNAQVVDLSDYAGTLDAFPGVSLSLSASVKIGSLATAVLCADGTVSRTLSGQYVGAGNLVKTGSGTMTLSGQNALTGVMTVRDGILKSNADGSVGPNVTVTETGMLDLNGKRGVKSLRLSGAGDGSKTHAALQAIADVPGRIGALALDGDATVTNVATLAFGSDDASMANAALNGFTLLKTGAGTLDFRNLKTGAGTLEIAGGALAVRGQGNLGPETALVIRPDARFESDTTESEDVSVKSVMNDGAVTGNARVLVAEVAGGAGSYRKLALAVGARLMPTDGDAPLTVTDELTLPAGGVVLDATKIATDAAAASTVKALLTPQELTDADLSAIVLDSSFAWAVKRERVGAQYLLSLVPDPTSRLRLEWKAGSADWTSTTFDGIVGYSDDLRQNVTFLDAADGSEEPLTVTVVGGPRTVTRMAFSNEVRAIEIAGERVVAYSIVKAGAGALKLSAPLTLAGGVAIEKGELVIDVPAGETSTIVGPITGAGNLVKTGDGTLVVSGASGAWTGKLTVRGGVARCGNELSFGVEEILVDGGTIDFNGVYLRNLIALSGDGALGNGALVNSGPELLGASGLPGLRLVGNASIGGDGNGYYWNVKTIDLAGHTLTKKGTFRWPLRANVFTGGGRIVVTDGVLDTNQGVNDLSGTALAVQSRGLLVLGGVKTTVKDFRSTSVATGHATLEVLGLLDADGAACTVPVLAFADEATLKGNGLTVSESLTFGAHLNVQGLGCGSPAMRYLADEPTGYDKVAVRVLGDASRLYSFGYDGDAKSLIIVANPIPPTFGFSDTEVVYGVDMTNAVVKFRISDYEAGAGYAGNPQGMLTVRDASGRVVAERGVVITGDGEYAFDAFDVLDGRGAGYSYDISIVIRQASLADTETLAVSGTSEYVVHSHAGWIDENAETFLKPAGDPSKTGTWTYPAGTAYVEDGFIVHGLSGGNLVFTPKTPSAQEVARVEATILIEDGTDMPSVSDLPAGAHAAFAVAAEGAGLVYAALTPALPEPVRLYSTGARPNPVAGSTCTVCADFNYARGTVTFTENGHALTNAAGSAFLPISAAGLAAKSLAGVTFAGLGRLSALKGEELNAKLAKAGGVAYDTVDEAVAALPEGGTVEMLWDALWHPTAADFDKKYVFTGGHDVVLDAGATNELARAGYVVVPNGDGSYTVSVIEYTLTFSANGGTGDDYTQAYTVTNLVFDLLANRFSTTNAEDFACWNAAADGSAPTNYADCATIDMSAYGLTNMTLYAQWKVAVRTITVATPDPFVYLELVTTNAPYALPAKHEGVKFFRTSGPGSEVSASFGVEHGSRVTITFSTDIEKQLLSDRLNYTEVLRNRAIGYPDLPKLVTSLGSRALSPYERWANAKGIAPSEFAASPYSMASFDLDTDALIDERTVVTLADFAVLADGCSFRVLIDGVPVRDRDAIAGMILLSDDLATWSTPPADAVSVDGETVRVRTAGAGKFVKIVVPRD